MTAKVSKLEVGETTILLIKGMVGEELSRLGELLLEQSSKTKTPVILINNAEQSVDNFALTIEFIKNLRREFEGKFCNAVFYQGEPIYNDKGYRKITSWADKYTHNPEAVFNWFIGRLQQTPDNLKDEGTQDGDANS